MKKKLITLFLSCAMALSLAACDTSSNDPAPKNDPAPSNNAGEDKTPEDVTPPSDDASANGDEASANEDASDNAPVAPTPSVSVGDTRDFNFVVLNWVGKSFISPSERNFCVGENVGDEGPMKYNQAADMIYSLYQQEANMDGEKATRNPNGFLISENGDFWWNVDKIVASFTVSDGGDGAYPLGIDCFQYIQPYIQMGAGSEVGTKWDWWSPTDPKVNLLYINGDPDGTILESFDGAALTVTWDFSECYKFFGETRPVPGVTSEDDPNVDWKGGNGFQKFGIQFGRNADNFDAYDSDLSIDIQWLSVDIYVKDVDAFMEYVNKGCELSGQTFDESLREHIHQA